MVSHVDAIFSQGAFRPLEPLVIPEATRVHLSVEGPPGTGAVAPKSFYRAPKLAHPTEVTDFVMEVRDTGNLRRPG